MSPNFSFANDAHFDQWSKDYDESVQEDTKRFPFIGYETVIKGLAGLVLENNPEKILDVGIGTGTLAQFVAAQNPSIEVWGIDFSAGMLEEARRKLPQAQLLTTDLARDNLFALKLPRFKSIISSYTLHTFSDEQKTSIIKYFIEQCLVQPGGLLAVGDIAFQNESARKIAQKAMGDDWDDSEYYFVADEFLRQMQSLGYLGSFQQISVCAGIFTWRI